jgi:YfiH family protein
VTASAAAPLHGRLGRVRWAYTDRHGGSSRPPYASANLGGHVGDDPDVVEANRAAVATDLGLDPAALRFMNQVHGDHVEVVGPDHARTDSGSEGDEPGVDGLVTDRTGVVLSVLVADCVPVLLADPAAGVVAAVHAGRPGLRAGVVERALDRMSELGARPSATTAWLGPAVCPRCYEVPEAMRADVASQVPASWSTSRTGTPALDLRAGLAAVLAASGVDVVPVGPCTAESPDHFSYRRDGVTGRFAGLVWLGP